MVEVIAALVRSRQRVPAQAKGLDVDGTIVMLRPDDVRGARDRARRTHKPHNEARLGFVKDVLGRLVTRYAGTLGVELDSDTRSELLETLRESRDVRREVNLCWMPLDPERLLRDLYADDAALARVASTLSARERSSLRRDRDAPWAPADV